MFTNRTWYLLPAILTILLIHSDSALGQGFAQNRGVATAAAVVNGEEIPMAELRQVLRDDRPPVHPLTSAQKAEITKMALEMLINDVLMRQFLAKNVPTVSTPEIEKEIAVLQQALAKKKKSLQQFLQETRQTEKQIRDDIATRLRWKAYVTKRIPDSLIEPYYRANKIFFDKVYVRASHILLKVPEKATPAQQQNYQIQMLKIREEITSGKFPFAVAARKYSQCTSKTKGGDIGHFPYKFVVAEPFAKAAFSMKVGQISAPVRTEIGYHLITVTERTKGEPTRFEDVKDVVRDVYAQEVQLLQSIVNEQRKTAKIQILAQ